MKYARLLLPVVTSSLLACSNPSEEVESIPQADFAEAAARLAQQTIIVDTHIDVPYRLEKEWVDVSVATDGGDFDYPRAVSGGLNAPFMSIYTPAEEEAEGTSKQTADRLIEMVNAIVEAAPDKFAIALSPADVEAHFEHLGRRIPVDELGR